MLVCMGVAMFVTIGTTLGMGGDALSRVIQGVATGIGFLGAGAIVKMEVTQEIHGLTTAAGIWMTSAIGVAIGVGRLGMAFIGVLVTWFVLAVVVKAEPRHRGDDHTVD
jgi:putative Mg2+ transporter-C (MgtC) family protein